MLIKQSVLLIGVLSSFAAIVARPGDATFAADEPNLLPLLEEEPLHEHAVVGTVVRKWNEQRQRHDFTIVDERDDIQYKILSGAGIDRVALVGHRVALQGRTRLHDDLEKGLVYPDHVTMLARDAQQASFLQDGSPEDSRRVATSIPTDININIGDTIDPYSVGTGVPGQPLLEYGMPGFPSPECGPDCASCARGSMLNGRKAWVGVDYLYWKTSGMALPPLVTTSPVPTAQNDAGVIGATGTQILVGQSEIFDAHRSGGRLRGGFWWNPQHGIEVEYLALQDKSASAATSTDTHAIIGIPFFNVNPRDPQNPNLFAPSREDAFLVSYPQLTSGSVAVNAKNRFESGGIRALMRLCGHSPGPNCPEDRRVDLIVGYRSLRLEDQLTMSSQVTTLNGTNQTFSINDSFATKNRFDGVELGAQVQGHWQRISYDCLAKIALGNISQEVTIDGSTGITTTGAGTISYVGGLFAQSSNIGSYSRDQFAVAPELNATIGYEFTKQLRATLGYNFIYLGRVLRAGDQIDREVNEDFLPPPENPFTGPQRPELLASDTSFWAQGVNLGVDFRW